MKTSKYTSLGILLGLCFGVALSYIFTSFSTTSRLSIGIACGLCLGLAIGSQIDSKINKQLDEKCYRVKEVSKNDDSIKIIIEDKNENREAVEMPLKSEDDFRVDTIVYLKEDRSIEKVELNQK